MVENITSDDVLNIIYNNNYKHFNNIFCMYYLLLEYNLQNFFMIYQVLQFIQIDHCIIDAAYLNCIIATKCNYNMIVGGLLNIFEVYNMFYLYS